MTPPDPVRKPSPDFAVSAFREFSGQLRRYLDRRLSVLQDVEDVAQEVYLRLLRLDSDKQIHRQLPFLYGVARRVLAEHRHQSRRKGAPAEHDKEPLEAHFNVISDTCSARLEETLDIEQRVERALAQLPPLKAAVLVMHYREGMTREEIAKELGVSVDTVKKYLAQGRATLRLSSLK